MTNSDIRKKIQLTAKLLELHGENPFKIRNYHSVMEQVDTLDVALCQLTEKEIQLQQGISKGMAKNITQLLATGTFDRLEELLAQTPKGVLEMFKISGFGPKKIAVLWKEGGATSIDDIRLMCLQSTVVALKGFAEKSQATLLRAVDFVIRSRGFAKYVEVAPVMNNLLEVFSHLREISSFSETAELRRRCEIINRMDFVVATFDIEAVRLAFKEMSDWQEEEIKSGPLSWYGFHLSSTIPIKIQFCIEEDYITTLFHSTAHAKHLHAVLKGNQTLFKILKDKKYKSEKEIYSAVSMEYVAPEMREGTFEIRLALDHKLPKLIKMTDLKGVLHNHSSYSDGKHTLRQMAEYCKSLGYEYLGISDHSQTAVYANGLNAERVANQQQEIIKLNQELAPFKIFFGIESDILTNGDLDYPNEILSKFDYIISSIHSGFQMDKNKATNRLLTAIHNPYTTILGHMTGRLILERKGYPVDHKAIIEACAEQKVVIEINANPRRLDIDWRWIQYAIEKGVMLSIDPDAHQMKRYDNVYYAVLVGRKGGLTKANCLNTMNCNELEGFFSRKKREAKDLR